MSGAVKKLIIAGGGTAGWMTAAALSRFIAPAGVDITLVESEQIGTIGVGEATIPGILDFNRMLGIDEADFIEATRGTYKLGIEFVDWGRKGDRYLHPFGEYGFELEGVPFHQFWSRARLEGSAVPLSDYSMCCQAAQHGRFMHPVSDPASPVSQLRYAYHFDASLYAAFLRRYAEARGVRRVEGRISAVHTDGESGDLTSLTLDNGSELSGDLFVDCTGFRGLLISEALGVPYEDWRAWLPCDRAIAIPTALTGAPDPFTRATARPAGWQWRIPLQHRVGNGHVYSSAYMSDEDAERILRDNLEGEALADPNRLRFTPGRRARFWDRNCVSIGLSGGFLEPLESTSIHLIQEGVSKLLALFPGDHISERERAQYNTIMGAAFDSVRDFLILHYHATERADSPFWDHVRTMDVPDSLTETIALFEENGRFFAHKGDLFNITSWVAVMVGQNILPRGADPVTGALSPADRTASLANMRETYRLAASKMPPHHAFIDHIIKTRQRRKAGSHAG